MTRHRRREQLVRRICKVMGWEYKTAHVYTGIRKVALAEAVPVGLDKLEAIIMRLEHEHQAAQEDRSVPALSGASH